MVGTRSFLIAAVIASANQAAFVEHGDLTPKVKLILDSLEDAGEICISPPIIVELAEWVQKKGRQSSPCGHHHSLCDRNLALS
jgi:hypothetical protein